MIAQYVFFRRRALIALRRTDIRRWTREESYNPSWDQRAAQAVILNGDAKWVVDLGCGRQALRTYLPKDVVYLPMDMAAWTPNTLVCDVNSRSLPLDYLRIADTCFILGVVEYLYDPGWLFSQLAEVVSKIIVSYNTMEKVPVGRRANGWVNDFARRDLLELMASSGFELVGSGEYGDEDILCLEGRWNSEQIRAARQEHRNKFCGRGNNQTGGPLLAGREGGGVVS